MDQRRCRAAGTAGALLRAALVFGPLGAVLAIALVAGSPDRPTGLLARDEIDDMATGSIMPARSAQSARGLVAPPNGRPCLRFPDGSQRGNC